MSESPLWHRTASPEVKQNYYKTQCLGFGFKSGSPEMAQCIQNQYNQSKSRNAQKQAAYERAYESQMMGNILRRPTTTNSTTFGQNINCISF